MSNVQGSNNRQISNRKAFPRQNLNEMTLAELQQTAKRLEMEGVTQLRKVELQRAIRKRLNHGLGASKGDSVQDNLSVEQISPFWLNVAWTVSGKSLERAAASLKTEWYRSSMILRLYSVSQNETGPSIREHVHDLDLPDGVSQWCVEFDARSRVWNIEIGFCGESGMFFSLLHSPDFEVDLIESFEKPHASDVVLSGRGNQLDFQDRNLGLELSGTLSLSGKSIAGCLASIDGENVKVDPQTGAFSWNHPLESGRMCFPVIVERHGQKQRAVVTIESNIQYLEFEKTSSSS